MKEKSSMYKNSKLWTIGIQQASESWGQRKWYLYLKKKKKSQVHLNWCSSTTIPPTIIYKATFHFAIWLYTKNVIYLNKVRSWVEWVDNMHLILHSII